MSQRTKLSHLSAGIVAAEIEKVEGKIPVTELENRVDAALGKYNLNDSHFRSDIARTAVRNAIASRSNISPFIRDEKTGLLLPAQFDRRQFKRGIIRLGDRQIVKMYDANYDAWQIRAMHQQQAASAAQIEALMTQSWLVTEPGLLLRSNPAMQTFVAMEQLSLWDADVADPPEDPEQDDDQDL